jgi:hypothetical protein
VKIKVTTERDCCQNEDLMPYAGVSEIQGGPGKVRFCKHCGQLWVLEWYTDAAGDRDTHYVRVIPKLP